MLRGLDDDRGGLKGLRHKQDRSELAGFDSNRPGGSEGDPGGMVQA